MGVENRYEVNNRYDFSFFMGTYSCATTGMCAHCKSHIFSAFWSIATETLPSMITPIIFQMQNLRRQGVYRNLSKHKFSIDEKTFAASEVCKRSTLLQWPEGISCTAGKFSKRYRISKSTVVNWKTIFENPRATFASGRGRPNAIDESAQAEIVATLQQRRNQRDALPLNAAYELINKVVLDTNKRRGKRGADANNEICSSTRKKICKTLDIRKLAPQILTDARKKGCECIRTSYVWGCLLLAYSGNLPAENKWNADATTIIVSENLTGSLVCAIMDDNQTTPVASSSIPDNLNILVKWFGLNNAAGESGPLVLIYAVPSMAEGTFFSAEVVSLASTTYIGEIGHVYFCKSRGGTYAMWKHYYLTITVPTIERSNSIHLNKVSVSFF